MSKENAIRVIARSAEGQVVDIVITGNANEVEETILYNGENLDVVDVLDISAPFDLSRYIIHKKRK